MELLVLSLIIIVMALVIVAVLFWRGSDTTERPTEGRDLVAPPGPGAPAMPKSRELRSRLAKSRKAIGVKVGALLQRSSVDASFYDDLEDMLVSADVGVAASSELVVRVREQRPADPSEAMQLLRQQMVADFEGHDRSIALDGDPAIVLVVGVNGGGKTTTIAKLAALLERHGKTVVLGAADTYRAAADQQLRVWADRLGLHMVAGEQGADPAAVAYDALASASARGAGAVIIDTAGRLQNQANLMSQLSKVANVLRREAGQIDEVLLVIDGTTGQNAISQAASFTEAVGVTGLVITKLDGTARGGVAVAVEHDLDLPVKYIGVGEGIDDLIPFDPEEFVEALLGS